jgi:hypothetical protein
MPARATVELRDFHGLITNADRYDLPEGAGQVQINLCSIILGELQVRQGIRELVFEGEPPT